MTDKEVIHWDATDPLKRVESESSASSKGLTDYALMGFNRSLGKLCDKYAEMDNPPTESRATVHGWSMKYDWVDRAKRHDELQRQRDEKIWRERRDNLRQAEWDNFDKLQNIISQLLDDMPRFIKRQEKIVQKGSPQIIDANGRKVRDGVAEEKVIILSFDVSAAIKFIRTASDIGRRAAEMDKGMPNLLKEIDFAKLTPEQITRVAEGEHLLDVLGLRK